MSTRWLVLLLVGVLAPAVAGAQGAHEEAPHAAAVPESRARAAGPKAGAAAPHEESRAEPTPARRAVRTPTEREPEPTRPVVRTPTDREPEPKRPVVRDVLKEDAEKLAAFKAAQAARAEAKTAPKEAQGEVKGTVKGETPDEVAGNVEPTAPRKGRKTATMSGRILTQSNKQLQDVADRVNARIDAVNASAPAPSEKNLDVEAIVAQINRRLERERTLRSAKRLQARSKDAEPARPRVNLSWRVPIQWSEVQAATDAQAPRPTQLSWPLPSWTPTAEVAQGQSSGRGQGPIQ